MYSGGNSRAVLRIQGVNVACAVLRAVPETVLNNPQLILLKQSSLLRPKFMDLFLNSIFLLSVGASHEPGKINF